MKDFKKSFKKKSYAGAGASRSFGKPGFRSAPRRDADAPLELFEATCARCKNSCQVPFRPNGKKPVLCKDCFAASKEDGASQPRSYGRAKGNDARTGDFEAQIALINAKLDTLTRLVKQLAE